MDKGLTLTDSQVTAVMTDRICNRIRVVLGDAAGTILTPISVSCDANTGVQWKIKVKTGDSSEGAAAGVGATVQWSCDGSTWLTLMTGHIDDNGAVRSQGYVFDDTLTFTIVDMTSYKGTKRKPSSTAYAGYYICNPADQDKSLVHILAKMMGVTAFDVGDLSAYVKDIVELGSSSVWQELQDIAECYDADLAFTADGKLYFHSPFEASWTGKTSDWTLVASRDQEGKVARASSVIGSISRTAPSATCNRAKSTFSTYERGDAGVIYRDTTNWNEATKTCHITIPGKTRYPESGYLSLKYKDPDSGEEYPYAVDVETPKIGGRGYPIYAVGGNLKLISFDGSTADTQKVSGESQIVLYNSSSDTCTIEGLEIYGIPYRKTAESTVEEVDSSVTDEVDYVTQEVEGKYATDATQLSAVLARLVARGKTIHRTLSLNTTFLPQVQVGEVMRLVTDDEDDIWEVTGYKHTMKGAQMSTLRTSLDLIEVTDYTPASAPKTVVRHPQATRQTTAQTQIEYAAWANADLPPVPNGTYVIDGVARTITDSSLSADEAETYWSTEGSLDTQAGDFIWMRTRTGGDTWIYQLMTSRREISSITYTYSVTATQDKPEDATSSTIPTMSEENKYLWQKELITYNDGATHANISLIAVYGDKGDQGATGPTGWSQATLQLFKRSATTPAKYDGEALTYTFATATLAGDKGTWSITIPSGDDPLYVIYAPAFGQGETDIVETSDWTVPAILSENGTRGENGDTVATVMLYKRSASTPAVPTGVVTYNFLSGAVSNTGSWSNAVPASDGNPLWVITAVASVTGSSNVHEDTIQPSEWSTPAIMAKDGEQGIQGEPGSWLELDVSNTALKQGQSSEISARGPGTVTTAITANGSSEPYARLSKITPFHIGKAPITLTNLSPDTTARTVTNGGANWQSTNGYRGVPTSFGTISHVANHMYYCRVTYGVVSCSEGIEASECYVDYHGSHSPVTIENLKTIKPRLAVGDTRAIGGLLEYSADYSNVFDPFLYFSYPSTAENAGKTATVEFSQPMHIDLTESGLVEYLALIGITSNEQIEAWCDKYLPFFTGSLTIGGSFSDDTLSAFVSLLGISDDEKESWVTTYASYPSSLLVTATDGTLTKRSTISYVEDGATGPQGPQGKPGDTGATGRGISSIAHYYATTSTQSAPDASSVTSTTIPTMSASAKYLWRKTVITYTDSTSESTVELIAVYGDTGDSASIKDFDLYLSAPAFSVGPRGYTRRSALIVATCSLIHISASEVTITWSATSSLVTLTPSSDNTTCTISVDARVQLSAFTVSCAVTGVGLTKTVSVDVQPESGNAYLPIYLGANFDTTKTWSDNNDPIWSGDYYLDTSTNTPMIAAVASDGTITYSEMQSNNPNTALIMGTVLPDILAQGSGVQSTCVAVNAYFGAIAAKSGFIESLRSQVIQSVNYAEDADGTPSAGWKLDGPKNLIKSYGMRGVDSQFSNIHVFGGKIDISDETNTIVFQTNDNDADSSNALSATGSPNLYIVKNVVQALAENVETSASWSYGSASGNSFYKNTSDSMYSPKKTVENSVDAGAMSYLNYGVDTANYSLFYVQIPSDAKQITYNCSWMFNGTVWDSFYLIEIRSDRYGGTNNGTVYYSSGWGKYPTSGTIDVSAYRGKYLVLVTSSARMYQVSSSWSYTHDVTTTRFTAPANAISLLSGDTILASLKLSAYISKSNVLTVGAYSSNNYITHTSFASFFAQLQDGTYPCTGANSDTYTDGENALTKISSVSVLQNSITIVSPSKTVILTDNILGAPVLSCQVLTALKGASVLNLNRVNATSQIGLDTAKFANVWTDSINNVPVTDSANQSISVSGASSIVGALNKINGDFLVYCVDGLLAQNDDNTIHAYGRATLFLVHGLAIVSFAINVQDVTSSSSSDFTFGILPAKLTELNSAIPAITPIGGGTCIYSYKGTGKTNLMGDLNGNGGTMLTLNGKWQFARVYQNYPETLVGGWPTAMFTTSVAMSGLCFGTY